MLLRRRYSPPKRFNKMSVLVFSGRYLFLNAIANQLRYPNSHTHYFSCTMLYLFAEANTEAIQEQITRWDRVCSQAFSSRCVNM